MLPLSWLQWIGHVLGRLWQLVQSMVEKVGFGLGGPIITFDNGMKVRRRQKLAEGGFSVVYLASGVVNNSSSGGSSSSSSNSNVGQYALKQIQCPDNETRSSCVREATVHYDLMRAQQQQQHRATATIMPLLGMAFVENNNTSNTAGNTTVCYMCFPYYPHSLRQEVNRRVFDPITAYYDNNQKKQKKNQKSNNNSSNSNHPMMRMSQNANKNKNNTEEEQIKSILRQHVPWQSVDVVLQMFSSLCDVVQQMHDAGYTHRDIKLENILLDRGSNNRTTHLVSPVLMDLGSAGPLTHELQKRQDVLHVVDEASQHTTISYRPPELWAGELRAVAHRRQGGGGNDDNDKNNDRDDDAILDYTKVDVWMLGCVLFAILFGVSPYECEFVRTTGQVKVVETTHNKILADTIPWPTEGTPSSLWYPSEIKELIQFILQKDRHERPTLHEVQQRVRTLLNQQHQQQHRTGSGAGSGTGARFQPMNILSSTTTSSSVGTTSRSNSLGSVDLESQVNELLMYTSTSTSSSSRH